MCICFLFFFYSNGFKVVEKLCNLKPIELKHNGAAEFEIEMSLKDPTSKVFIFKVN